MNWQARPLGPRAVAAAMSIGATAMLWVMLAGGQRRVSNASPARPIAVTLIPIPSARPSVPHQPIGGPLAAVEQPRRAAGRPSPGRAPSTIDPAVVPDSAVPAGPTTPALATLPVAEAPPAAASAPLLKLDEATIRAAGARSPGLVRRLAEASGQVLPGSDRSNSERLGSAVAEAAKPDCLAPNEQGSLLSLPIIALAAIAGRCH